MLKKKETEDENKPFIARGVGSLNTPGLTKGGALGISKPDYGTGDRVRHIKYGEGTVTAIEQGPRDYQVTVTFDNAGNKIMYAAFAKLKKL